MKVLFISLGCDKNLVDSEVMLGLIQEKGMELTDEEDKAEVIVINTCCFINDAKEESINTILEMAQLKKTGNLKSLIVTGCLSQRYRDEILKEIPEIDGILGTTGYEEIVTVILDSLKGKEAQSYRELDYLPEKIGRRVNTTGGYYSYLKIAEGCDKRCTYCIIPKIRGRYHSIPLEQLVEEANELAKGGVAELMLVAQESTLYGIDLYGEKRLVLLLKELAKIPSIQWIRLLYCYPEEITDELIQQIKTEPKICHYLDLPIQHCSDSILKRMGRKATKDTLTKLIRKLRREIPDISLRTTLITGFPGETQQDHEELLAFVKEMRFDRLGVFPYSPEEGTGAAELNPKVPEDVKQQRYHEIMELQQSIAFEKAQEMISQTVEVLIEGKLPDENVYIGRTYKDAPNIDGYIFVNSSIELYSGEYVKAFVTDARDYDLIGSAVWEEENEK